MLIQKNKKISSFSFLGLVWIVFSLIVTFIGIKLNNIILSLGLIISVPTIIFLMKVPKRLIYAQIIYILIIKIFITMFHFPSSAMYVIDIINILAFAISIGKMIEK